MNSSIRPNPKLIHMAKPVYLAVGVLGIFIMLGSLWGAFKVFGIIQMGGTDMVPVLGFPAFFFFIGAMISYQGFSMWKIDPKDISLEVESSEK